MGIQAEIIELKRRLDLVEAVGTGLRTAFIKLVPLVEETRLRVSAIEEDVGQIKNDLRSFRGDVPAIVAEAMREVLKEKKRAPLRVRPGIAPRAANRL